ncbi:hypothetical protein FGO68_gene15903 [Halteria grandinella]|uniref:Uncharacterized protein n=1 Tax=Halteria grandinella TaxID=5974 RepID=A0A8J8SZ04_HALGN|nr:hypothetical protein FGO68_gene15903 [Halteria grandinella]
MGLQFITALFASASLISLASAQAQLTTFNLNLTAACTLDSNCAAQSNYCCGDVKRTNISTSTANWTTITKTCIPYDLQLKTVVYAGNNYTFNCTNATAITAIKTYNTNLGNECSANSGCSAGCCAARQFTIWTSDWSLPSYCLANSLAGNYQWATYKIGTTTNFTTEIVLTSRCYTSEPSLTSAVMIKSAAMVAMAVIAIVYA